jgi:hypothetical protein
MDGSPPSAAGELNPRPPEHRRHPLILDGLRLRASSASSRQVPSPHRLAQAGKCLHVLSSFQRTGFCCYAPRRLFRALGNLAILPIIAAPVNPPRHLVGSQPPPGKAGPRQTGWGGGPGYGEKKFARRNLSKSSSHPGRVTLGPSNIRAPCAAVKHSRSRRVRTTNQAT